MHKMTCCIQCLANKTELKWVSFLTLKGCTETCASTGHKYGFPTKPVIINTGKVPECSSSIFNFLGFRPPGRRFLQKQRNYAFS